MSLQQDNQPAFLQAELIKLGGLESAMRRGASALVNLEPYSMTPLLTPRHDNSM